MRCAESTPTWGERLTQAGKFWQAVLCGPERKLPRYEEVEGAAASTEGLLAWVASELDVGLDRLSPQRTSKNPQSETLVVQVADGGVSDAVFVKRAVTLFETGDRVVTEGFDRERRALRAVAGLEDSGVAWPRLLAESEELSAVALSYIDGVSFFNVLFQSPLAPFLDQRAPGDDKERALRNLGQWLRRLHGLDGGPAGEDVAEMLSREISAIEMRLKHLGKSRPVDFPVWVRDGLLKLVANAAGGIRSLAPRAVFTHGDFTLANLLYKEGRVGVVDFAEARIGLPEDDLARVCLDLFNVERFTFSLARPRLGSYSRAFAEGYSGEHARVRPPVERFFLVKHVLINLYMYTKQWGNKKFLHPIYCRLFYSFQMGLLRRLLRGETPLRLPAVPVEIA